MNIHPSFRLNNHQFENVTELLSYTKSLDEFVYIFLTEWFNKSTYVEVNTSGSTGTPKIIKLQKDAMVYSAIATGTYLNLFQGIKALLCMSSEYIAGKMMLVRALTLGWELDVVKAESNPLSNLNKTYDFCAMVPLQFMSSWNDLYKVKKIIVGGGSLSESYLKEIQQIPTEVYATYGMTETSTHVAIQKLNHHPTNYYQCLPTIKVSTDTRGCLIIYAPEISKDEFITNDLVELISDTQFKWLGRVDTVINSGGVKLVPEVIESKINAFIEKPYFIAAEKDEKLGEKVILVIESTPFSQFEKKELEQKLKTVLNNYEVPKTIYFIDTFIRTETKKIQRSQTLDLILNHLNS